MLIPAHMMSTVEFDPSLLGTKDHWDHRYSEELAHFYESGLEGEIWQVWRGTRGKDDRLGLDPRSPDSSSQCARLGHGNGHLLFSMVEAGYDASRLTGIDYSQGSVDLCTAIAKRQNGAEDDEKHACGNVTFAVCDFLDPESPVPPPRGESTSDGVWDLVLDKGTFDAISLMDKDE
ncbi:hypothetical protein HD554DRAFT_581717 [Boletus coccyginus]|nr:hypothetical protein HD554DRAFT_581717 [Boletus coccyginus]